MSLKYGLLNTLILIVGTVLCLLQAQPNKADSDWRVVSLPTPTAHPLRAAIILEDFVVWQRFDSNALCFFNLQDNTPQCHRWLHGTLVQWTAQLLDNRIYLVWRTDNNALYTAVLNDRAEQLTAPILISNAVVTDFRVTDYQGLMVLWQSGRTLSLSKVDAEGRPRPPVELLTPLDDFAVVHDSVVWRDNDTLWMGVLDFSQARPTLTPALSLDTFKLAPDEMLATLHIFLSETHRVIVWGISHVMQPDAELYQGVLLPIDGLADPIPFQITLPENAPTRWANPTPEGGLTMAAFIDGKWQTITLNFGANGTQGFQIIEGAAALASAPMVAGDHAAWITLDEHQMPILYVTTRDERYGQAPDDTLPQEERIIAGLEKSYLALAWLLLPAIAAYFFPSLESAALAAYWVSKVIFSFGIFAAAPVILTPLAAFGLIHILAVGVRLVGWGSTPLKIRWGAYFLTDALLTFALFAG